MQTRLVAVFLVTSTFLAGTIALRPWKAEHEPRVNVRAAATALLGTLNDTTRNQASFAFEELVRFHPRPLMGTVRGLPLGQMTREQRRAAGNLLRSLLDAQRLLLTSRIAQMESILRQLEADDARQSAENYYFSFFGEPDSNEPWAWRLDGRRVALHYTEVEHPVVSITPVLVGSATGAR